MIKTTATVHGAISVVNAIATGYGSTIGISLKVIVEIIAQDGSGIVFKEGNGNNLTNKIITDVLPDNFRKKKLLIISINSEIPQGMGLKSSSAVSNAVALACHGLISDNIDDDYVLNSAINASLFAETTITGAYDDAAACYYGGLIITDNYKRKILRRDVAPDDLSAIVFLPSHTRRGNVANLKILHDLFFDAYQFAYTGEYWKAMILNGLLTTSLLSNSYDPVRLCLENGAISAGMSGNGPAIAAVCRSKEIDKIKSSLISLDGNVMISPLNNKKATVVRVVD